MDVFEELEQQLTAIEKKFAGGNWKESLADITREVRMLGTQFAQQGKIKGFALDINDVDASKPLHVLPGPVVEAVLKNEVLQVKLTVAGHERNGHMTITFGDTSGDETGAPVTTPPRTPDKVGSMAMALPARTEALVSDER